MNGDDLRKWYISKTATGSWFIMPPVTDNPRWFDQGTLFPTGAQALAAFARGEQP